MGQCIKKLRKEGEEIIESIITYINKVHEYDTKEKKNEVIKSMLAEPRGRYNIPETTSLGFIELDEENSVPVINELELQRKAKQIMKKRIEALREEWVSIRKDSVLDEYYEKRESSIEEIRKAFLNKEIDFFMLDSTWEASGYHSVFDGNIRKIRKNKKIVYRAMDSSKHDMELSFVITRYNFPVDLEECFRLKITDIKRI